jgi:hypothetical protein
MAAEGGQILRITTTIEAIKDVRCSVLFSVSSNVAIERGKVITVSDFVVVTEG